MRLLSLDQASRVSGWAVFIDGELKEYGHLTTSDEEIGKRLVKIRQFIIDKCAQWDIDTIAFEDIQLQASVGNNVKTFKVLANVFGVVLETSQELGKNYKIIPSSHWKSKLGIKGPNRPVQKKHAQEYVIDKYGVKPSQDEADAICIGTCMLIDDCANMNHSEGFDWS